LAHQASRTTLLLQRLQVCLPIALQRLAEGRRALACSRRRAVLWWQQRTRLLVHPVLLLLPLVLLLQLPLMLCCCCQLDGDAVVWLALTPDLLDVCQGAVVVDLQQMLLGVHQMIGPARGVRHRRHGTPGIGVDGPRPLVGRKRDGRPP
jgi:hypothetical protein